MPSSIELLIAALPNFRDFVVLSRSEICHFLRKEHRPLVLVFWLLKLLWNLGTLPMTLVFSLIWNNCCYFVLRLSLKEHVPGSVAYRTSLIDTVLFKSQSKRFLQENVGLFGPVFVSVIDWQGSLIDGHDIICVCFTPGAIVFDATALRMIGNCGFLSASLPYRKVLEELLYLHNYDPWLVVLEASVSTGVKEFLHRLKLETRPNLESHLMELACDILFQVLFGLQGAMPPFLKAAFEKYLFHCSDQRFFDDRDLQDAKDIIMNAIHVSVVSHNELFHDHTVVPYRTSSVGATTPPSLLVNAWQRLEKMFANNMKLDRKLEFLLAFAVEFCYARILAQVRILGRIVLSSRYSMKMKSLRIGIQRHRQAQLNAVRKMNGNVAPISVWWTDMQRERNQTRQVARNTENKADTQFSRRYGKDQSSEFQRNKRSWRFNDIGKTTYSTFLHSLQSISAYISSTYLIFKQFILGEISQSAQSNEERKTNQQSKEKIYVSILAGPHFSGMDESPLLLNGSVSQQGERSVAVPDAEKDGKNSRTEERDNSMDAVDGSLVENSRIDSLEDEYSEKDGAKLIRAPHSYSNFAYGSSCQHKFHLQHLMDIVQEVIDESEQVFYLENKRVVSFSLYECVTASILRHRQHAYHISKGEQLLLIYDVSKYTNDLVPEAQWLSDLILSVILYEWVDVVFSTQTI